MLHNACVMALNMARVRGPVANITDDYVHLFIAQVPADVARAVKGSHFYHAPLVVLHHYGHLVELVKRSAADYCVCMCTLWWTCATKWTAATLHVSNKCPTHVSMIPIPSVPIRANALSVQVPRCFRAVERAGQRLNAISELHGHCSGAMLHELVFGIQVNDSRLGLLPVVIDMTHVHIHSGTPIWHFRFFKLNHSCLWVGVFLLLLPGHSKWLWWLYCYTLLLPVAWPYCYVSGHLASIALNTTALTSCIVLA